MTASESVPTPNTLELLGAKPSMSEDRGLAILEPSDKVIFSPGISTGGFAEVRMAMADKNRKIVATTLDNRGLQFTNELITQLNLQDQIETRHEDLRGEWKYAPNSFDVIYARLVLHYLPAEDLDKTLSNFSNSLKSGGKIFIVVQSDKNIDPHDPNFAYEPDTHFTVQSKYSVTRELLSVEKRYWHTPESIKTHLEKAGFIVDSISEYEEQLYHDYARRAENVSPKMGCLIEVIARKPK